MPTNLLRGLLVEPVYRCSVRSRYQVAVDVHGDLYRMVASEDALLVEAALTNSADGGDVIRNGSHFPGGRVRLACPHGVTRNTMLAGLPTGVYCPVNASRWPPSSMQ